MELPNIELPQEPPCVATTDLLNNVRLNENLSSRHFRRYHFRFISYCPQSSNISKETKDPCENGGNRFEDYIPVSSTAGDKVFKNIHCAKCHGFEEVVSWKLYLLYDCLSTLNTIFANQEEREATILKQCMLNSYPPSNFYGEMVSCHEHDITKFECKNFPEVQNSLNQSKCTEKTFPYNSVARDVTKYPMPLTFTNIFCLLCFIQPTNLQWDDQCPVFNFAKVRSSGTYSLAILISLSGGLITNVQTTEQRCSYAEVFDPYIVSNYFF